MSDIYEANTGNITFKPHPHSELFPVLKGDEAKQLQDDLQFPIILYQGKILDGRNRYNACVALGMTENHPI